MRHATTFAPRARRRIAASLAAALLLLATAPALADDVADEADLQFTLGAERYQAGDYRAALEHFLSSNRLVPNRNVLFNIARTFEALKQYPDAYKYYARALQGETDAAARARIDEALKRMAPNVAILKVTTDPPGATLYLDRKDLGQRGAGPQTFGLPAGKYSVIAEAAGYEDATSQPIEVRIGATATIDLKLKRILGTVRVEGEAQGAQVRVDREDGPPASTIPGEIELPPGRHTLFISREGFKTTETIIDVIARQTLTVHPSVEAKTGSLVVSADEPGAVVEVDGRTRGPAPALIALPVGTHAVRVSLKGFRPVDRTVVIAANGETRLEGLSLVPVEEVEAASRASESVEDAPASVTIIPSQELRGMGYPTVWAALRGVRGVYLSDDRGYATVGFRGFSRPGDYGNRVLVLLDGQPMNDNWVWSSYVGYDLRTDIDDVERIEVVRGPGSVLYGTGAFSGVINVVTRPRDAKPGYELGVSTADYGVARARARAAYSFGHDAGLWTSVSASHAAGRDFFFPEYASSTPPSIAGNARGVDGFDTATWTGRAWWKSLTAQWSLNAHDKHLPAGQFDTIFGDERTHQTDTRGMFEVRLEPQITTSFQSLSRAHVNYYSYKGEFAGLPDNDTGGLSRTTFYGLWAGVEQRFLWSPISALRLTVGGEFQNHFKADQLIANEVIVAPATTLVPVDDHRSFQIGAGYLVADVTPSPRVKISAGTRLDAYSTFGTSLNPRIALILRPYDAGNVKLIFGKAFRAPSTYELFYSQPGTLIANPNLAPEQIYSAEIEYSHRFSPNVVGLVSVYENYITGLITQATLPGSDTPQYQNTNVPVATLGGEVEIRKDWKEGWMASASYSYQRSLYLASESAESLLKLEKNHDLREVPNAPDHLASLRAGAPIINRALMAMTRIAFSGQRYDRNEKPTDGPQLKSDPAVVWDLVLTGSEQRWNLRYALGIYNVLDWRYSVPVSPEFRQNMIVQNGRTLLASASVTF
jgi:outer membrane receptor protein involved in Fe transport